MANRRRFSSRTPAAKRSTFWVGGTLGIAQLVPGVNAFFTVISEATLENVPNPTIVRSRLELICMDDESVSAPDSMYLLSYGCGIVERNAAIAGIASIPSPTVDIDWDGWFVHGAFTGGSATSGLIDSPLGVQRQSVDSKAMRKVGQNEICLLVIEMNAIQGTEAIQFWGQFRFLLKK